jgi:hypothetical protein
MAFIGAGAGIQEDPYQITTASQYMSMSNFGSSAYFKLMNDIDLTGYFAVIYNFSSHLDGDNKKVTNVNISNATSNSFGAFNVLNGSSIRNIKIELYNINEKALCTFIDQQYSTRTNIYLDNIHIIFNSIIYPFTFVSESVSSS